MTYSVYYGDDLGAEATISGYLLMQPFHFQKGMLSRPANESRLVIQLHLSRSEDVEYPSPTAMLPMVGDYEIRDTVGNTPVTASAIKTEAIFSSQSFDLASTTWVLAGTNDSAIGFAPPEHPSAPIDDRANYYPWRGMFDAGDGHQLKLSYLDCAYSFRAGRRGVHQLFASGPANADGVGTMFNFVAGAAENQPLSAASVIDPHRNATLPFFGADNESIAQMNMASGVVFALNGTFKLTSPANLRTVLAAAATGNVDFGVASHPLWHSDPFENMAQKINDTEQRTGGNKGYQVVGPDVEGILLWGMNALQGKVAAALL